MRDKIFEIIKEINEYNHNSMFSYLLSDFSKLSKFIDKKLNKSLFKRKNAKALLSSLEYIVAYTNSKNIDWISNKLFVTQKDFLPTFKSSIRYFKFKNNIIDLIKPLNIYYTYDEIFDRELVNEIITIKPNTEVLDYVYKRINYSDKIYFIENAIHNGIDITSFLDKNTIYMFNDYFETNINNIISKSSINTINLKKLFGKNKKITNIINNYIDDNPNLFIESILNTTSNSVKIRVNSNTIDIIKLIVEDICKNEKIKFSDIEEVYSGRFSIVIVIKNKVLKIGHERITENFPNNPYKVKPIIRKKIKIDNQYLFVEVTEKVDKNIKIGINETYTLYKKIRNLGLVWDDIEPSNIGILLKDNLIYWNKLLPNNDNVLGLEKRVDENHILKKGELVLMDADSIYKEDNYQFMNDNVNRFETQFQAELSDFLEMIKSNNYEKMEYNRLLIECGFKKEYINKKMKLENKRGNYESSNSKM